MRFGIIAIAALAALQTPTVFAQNSNGSFALAPAEPALDRYLATADAAALARAAEQGDADALYLLFVLHQRSATSSAEAGRWLARLASANTPPARYAYALARYRGDLRARNKGVELVAANSLTTQLERQQLIVSLTALGPQFPKAYALLAQIHRDGMWIPTDNAKAVSFLKQGAAAGAAPALLGLSHSLMLEGSPNSEVARLADAAVNAGEPAAQIVACAAYIDLERRTEALARCRPAADSGMAWAQLVTGELMAPDKAARAAARRYLSLATQSDDPVISERASLRLAEVSIADGAYRQAVTELASISGRSSLAAWMTGRLYLDHLGDAGSAERWLTQASKMPGADVPGVTYDHARAVKARGGDWTAPLQLAASSGHTLASLTLAFELLGQSPNEARKFAMVATKDPALEARAKELIAFIDGSKN